MARTATAKKLDERIDIRTRPDIKKMIQRAAEAVGSDISKFVISNAYEAAKKILADQESFELSVRDRDLFLAAIENPAAPNEALKLALKKYQKSVR